MNENLQKLLENEELMAGLVEVQTPEELQALLDKNAVALEDGLTIEEAFKLLKEQESAEISEAELENVAGGIGLVVAATSAGLLALSAGMLCFLGGYAYQTYKNWKKKK